MKHINQIALGLILITSISSYAADVKMTIPIFSQKLEMSYSALYKVGSQASQGNVFMMEFVPKAESVQTWNELLVVSGYKDMASTQTADSAMKLETDSVKAACPKDFVLEKIEYKNPQNYPSSLAIFGCSKHPSLAGKSELALQLVIQGKKDIYLIKKAFHHAIGVKNGLSKANYKTLAAEVLNVQLCKNDGQSPICKPEAK
jgi:hypothetical protein